jgi:COP9 signalosome complex subunit 2
LRCRGGCAPLVYVARADAALAAALAPQVLLKIVQPYTRVRIPFIAAKLNIPAPDVEQLLVSLILDGRVEGTIDQVGRVTGRLTGCCVTWSRASACGPGVDCLCTEPQPSSTPALRRDGPVSLCADGAQVNQILEVGNRQEGARRYAALEKWANQIGSLHAVVQNRLVAGQA